MTSMMNVRDGDLWTETVRALGIRTTGKRSPFRDLETREDALGMVRDCSIALLLVGLVQISLSWFAGVGSGADALVYMPLAGLLYRYSSRLAAALLLAFALFSVAVTILGTVSGIEARADLVLIATLLWASVRAVEATSALVRGSGELEQHAERPRRRRSSTTRWLLFAGVVFLFVVGAKLLPPLQLSPEAVSPVASAPSEPVAKSAAPAAVPEAGRLRTVPPDGFVDPRAEEPGIASMAEGFVPSAMELAALYVTPPDVEDFRRDQRFAPARYVMVQSVRMADARPVSEEDFRVAKAGGVAAGAERIEKLIGADAALAQWLESVLRAAGTSVELDGTRIRNEGALDESDRSISVGSIVETSAVASRVVITSLVLARGKVLVVYTYGPYTKSDDATAAHTVARQVVQNLVRENPA